MNPHRNPDAFYIRNMFDRLAPRYDLFNHLTSLGLATRWRRRALEEVRPGMRVLDLGCGTGDMSLEAVRRVGDKGEVVGLDFSERMLERARQRSKKAGFNGRIRFVQGRAEDLPMEERPYDIVVSGFVLRNLYENIDSILTGVYRALAPGGRIRFLDITEPSGRLKRNVWKFYMHTAAALYGKALFGKDYPMFYLTESASRFVKPADFTKKLRKAGFGQVAARPFMLGSVTLYSAEKVAPAS